MNGGEHFPLSEAALREHWREVAQRTAFAPEQVRAVWALRGTQTAEILSQIESGRESVPGTDLPSGFVAWVIEHEWVRRLDDLVERRLMLLYDRRLSETTLRRLAELLVRAGRLADSQAEAEVRGTVERLSRHFGKRLPS